jgi:hypothetical protein
MGIIFAGILGILYYILVAYPHFKNEEKALNAVMAYCIAEKEFNDYLRSDEINKADCLIYEIPNSINGLNQSYENDLTSKRIRTNPKFKELYVMERETFIEFLKTHSYCIKSQKKYLITSLKYLDKGSKLSDDIMLMIFLY